MEIKSVRLAIFRSSEDTYFGEGNAISCQFWCTLGTDIWVGLEFEQSNKQKYKQYGPTLSNSVTTT
jgi:predicted metalloprotease